MKALLEQLPGEPLDHRYPDWILKFGLIALLCDFAYLALYALNGGPSAAGRIVLLPFLVWLGIFSGWYLRQWRNLRLWVLVGAMLGTATIAALLVTVLAALAG